MTGRFLILDAESREAVEDFVKNDPFTRVGLFSTAIIERWKHEKHTEESARRVKSAARETDEFQRAFRSCQSHPESLLTCVQAM